MYKIMFQIFFASILAACFFCNSSLVFAGNANGIQGIPPRLAADLIYSVIKADRRFYSESIVARLEKTISLKATEKWSEENTLLLPAQFLFRSSEISNLRNIGMKYRLLSLWPINKNNSPRLESEKIALQEIIKNPNKPFTRIIQMEKNWYFQATYPDRAITKSCVSCHNNHAKSPKKDFKMEDVMGGIIIYLPLGKKGNKNGEGEFFLSPEVVSNYVHSILDADRYVYSKYIVDRLQYNNILHASENWEDTNSLPLPAQFLLNASQLIKKKNLGLEFRLISLWPINPQNSPANEFERIGLESFSLKPIRPYTGKIKIGKKQFFKAIYPDYAVAPSCVSCHNGHMKSPKRDFKMFQVMGGMLVTIDLAGE